MVKGFVTTAELAERLGISTARVRRMILDGVVRNVERTGAQNLIPIKEAIRIEGLDRKTGRPPKVKAEKTSDKQN